MQEPKMPSVPLRKHFARSPTEAFALQAFSPGFVKTGFADNIKNEEMKTAIQKGMEQTAIDPVAVANAVIYAISQPDDVEIGDIVIRPSKQN